MIERARADLEKAADVSRGIPPWILLAILLGAPGGSALMAGSMTTSRMEVVVEQLQEQLKGEISERKQFETRCASERAELDKTISSMRLAQSEQQLLLTHVRQTQDRLLDQMRNYQAEMLGMVRHISEEVPGLRLGPKAGPAP